MMPLPSHPYSGELLFLPPVIAHRGARWRAPENTLAAFAAAKSEGAAWIETDVKLTRDGIPILMHDDTVDRTTNGKGAVADMDWADLVHLEVHNGGGRNDYAGSPHARIPRLADALHFAIENFLHLNLEIKPCPGRTQATTMIALIEGAKIWPTDHPPPLISSFDTEALMMALQLHPDWPRSVLLDTWRDDWTRLVIDTEASTINLNANLLTKERVEKLTQSKLPILAYTVNDPQRAKELLYWGVSAVFTDNPGEIIKFL